MEGEGEGERGGGGKERKGSVREEGRSRRES